MDAVVEQLGDKVVFVDVQRGSSNYGSPSGDVVTSNVKPFATYTPSFWLIDDSVNYNEMGSASKAVSYTRNKYNALEAAGVKAHIAFEKTISGNTLTVKTVTKFFKEMTGDYYVNIMLLESGFEAQQSGAPGGSIIASRVLRVIFSGENGAGDEKFWDTKIASGTTAAGTEVSKNFSTTLKTAWKKDSLTVVATIWYKSGNTIKEISSEDIPGNIGGDTQAPTVTVTSPTGADTIETESEHTITWTASDNVGVVARAVYFSKDDGSNWVKVDSTQDTTSSYVWTAPGSAAEACKIKVLAYDAAGNVGSHESETFTIIPATAITSQTSLTQKLVRFKRTKNSFLVYVPIQDPVSITVTDVKGKVVSSFKTSQGASWYSLGTNLSTGIFIVRLDHATWAITKKFRTVTH